jgi:hypothetical protein
MARRRRELCSRRRLRLSRSRFDLIFRVRRDYDLRKVVGRVLNRSRTGACRPLFADRERAAGH